MVKHYHCEDYGVLMWVKLLMVRVAYLPKDLGYECRFGVELGSSGQLLCALLTIRVYSVLVRRPAKQISSRIYVMLNQNIFGLRECLL